MSDLKEKICIEAEKIGVDCSMAAISITITVWHLLVFAALSIIAGVLIRAILEYANIAVTQWKQSLGVKSHEKGAVNYPNTVMLNAHRMRDMLEVDGLDGLSSIQTAQALNAKFEKDYFLVQFRENGGQLFRKELKIRAGWRMINYFEFRTDPDTLKVLKAKGSVLKSYA